MVWRKVTAQQREGIVNYIQRKGILLVLPTSYGKSLLFQLLPGIHVCRALDTMGYTSCPKKAIKEASRKNCELIMGLHIQRKKPYTTVSSNQRSFLALLFNIWYKNLNKFYMAPNIKKKPQALTAKTTVFNLMQLTKQQVKTLPALKQDFLQLTSTALQHNPCFPH